MAEEAKEAEHIGKCHPSPHHSPGGEGNRITANLTPVKRQPYVEDTQSSVNASRMVEKERKGMRVSPTIGSPTWDDYGLPTRHQQQDKASPEEEEASVIDTAGPPVLADGDVSMAESALDVTMTEAKTTGPNQTAGARYEANPEASGDRPRRRERDQRK